MFTPLITLIGACLVALGSRGAVVQVPGLDDVTLFEMGRAAAWTVCVGAALAVPLAWMRQRVLAAVCVAVALMAVGFLFHELTDQIHALRLATDNSSTLEKILAATQFKPGAACVGGGLLIQIIALLFRDRAPAEVTLIERCVFAPRCPWDVAGRYPGDLRYGLEMLGLLLGVTFTNRIFSLPLLICSSRAASCEPR